jgi:hypothetical protein
VKKFLDIPFLKDVAERTVSTYVQAFLGLELSDMANLTSIGATKAVAIAALPAALAVIKAGFKGAAKQDSAGV